MSKQSEAKIQQGYVDKAVPKTCGQCLHFTSDTVTRTTIWLEAYTIESNLRCSIGGFAVKKMATCNLFNKS